MVSLIVGTVPQELVKQGKLMGPKVFSINKHDHFILFSKLMVLKFESEFPERLNTCGWLDPTPNIWFNTTEVRPEILYF